jgi:hypothetical protein
MDRRPAGRPGLSESLTVRAHQWAEQSCLDQQLPAKMRDPRTVKRVARLLGAQPAADRRLPAPADGADEGTRTA